MTAPGQVVMAAIFQLRDDAYGVTIHRKTDELVRPRSVPLGSVYFTLDRLEDEGLISPRLADPDPTRGGRRKRYYRLEALAERAPLSAGGRVKAAVERIGKEAGSWEPSHPK
jgi:PadR family transcriptional regulator PadR